jgi:transcriptional regulator with XRE-family HTH domain
LAVHTSCQIRDIILKHRPATVQVRTWRKRRRLTPEQTARVRALPWTRGSGRALARELGVSPTLISDIRRGLAYKRELPQATYVARVTDGNERYALGSFLTPEAAQDAIDKFARTNKWPRGSVERVGKRYRARLSLGIYDTHWAGERACAKAIAKLSAP